jgi:transcriptional regulator with XRE-family HTH domain
MDHDTFEQLVLLTEARDAAKSGRGRRIRELARVTQQELGTAVGVDGSAISRWECGTRRPSGEAALLYAKALKTLSQA